MNRRNFLTSLVATAIAAAVPAVEATATWVEIHDGSDFTLGEGDWIIEMWFRHNQGALKLGGGLVDEFSLRAGSEKARHMLEGFGMTEPEAYEVVSVSVQKYGPFVPNDGDWHHLFVQRGGVFVDGTLTQENSNV